MCLYLLCFDNIFLISSPVFWFCILYFDNHCTVSLFSSPVLLYFCLWYFFSFTFWLRMSTLYFSVVFSSPSIFHKSLHIVLIFKIFVFGLENSILFVFQDSSKHFTPWRRWPAMYSRIQIYLMALGRQYRLEHTTICISHTNQCEWGWEVHTLISQKIFWGKVFFQQNIFLPRHLSHKLRVKSECFNYVFNIFFDTSSLLIIWEIHWGRDGHTFRQLLWGLRMVWERLLFCREICQSSFILVWDGSIVERFVTFCWYC